MLNFSDLTLRYYYLELWPCCWRSFPGFELWVSLREKAWQQFMFTLEHGLRQISKQEIIVFVNKTIHFVNNLKSKITKILNSVKIEKYFHVLAIRMDDFRAYLMRVWTTSNLFHKRIKIFNLFHKRLKTFNLFHKGLIYCKSIIMQKTLMFC